MPSLVSFVIPARNEEEHIGSTLRSIHRVVGEAFPYEIIVADNDSSDGTARSAREHGATVIPVTGGTVAGVRNEGARHAEGDLLVFLDADITLTTDWPAAFREAAEVCVERPATLSGSICAIPADSGWIERYWFGRQPDASFSHLGSAHLIIASSFFERLGGFDESLVTGEDYDFSVRSIRKGGAIHRLPASVVEHHGFPKTLRQFFRREMWHGTGDCTSLHTVVGSKVALVAAVFLLLHVALAVSLAIGASGGAVVVGLAIAGLCVASSVHRFRGEPLPVLMVNSFLYYVYYLARATCFWRLIKRSPRGGRTAVADRAPRTS